MLDAVRHLDVFQRWRERRELRLRIAEELRFHLEAAIAENAARGLSGREAKAEASARLGNRRAIAAECVAAGAADPAPRSLLGRQARSLSLAAAAAIAPPALALLLLSHHLKRLPVESPETLAVSAKAAPDAFSLAKQAPGRAAAFRPMGGRLRLREGAFAAAGFRASRDFFRLQGVQPALGSLPGEGESCLVLSDRLWRNRFAADPGVIGRAVELDRSARRVCAVMPQGYWFISRSGLFWLLEDPGAQGQGFLLLRASASDGDSALEFPKSIPLSEASRGALPMAFAVLLAALALLSVLGAVETAALARTLGGWRGSCGLLARSYAFLLVKALPALAVLAILWTTAMESPSLAPVGYFAEVWALVTLYLFALLSTAAVWYSIVDQRGRCPVCQRTLGMPLGLGVPGSILFDLPAVEYICAYGHGTLYRPEPTSEGVCQPAWRAPKGWWNEVLGMGAPSGEASG